MRCALGQTWTGSTCSGTAGTYSYNQAVALTNTFAGHSDWRLPNIAELQTIVERENVSPAINGTLFPNTLNNGFWSSSPYVGNSNYAWYVNFSNGLVYDGYFRDFSLPVRLVRASQSLGIGLASPDTEFSDNKDGTVTHKRTGLMWRRCSVGQAWDDTTSTCTGSAERYSYDDAIALRFLFAGYSDWRVPTANELASIVKYDTVNSAINTTMFPNTPSEAFWSSSPYVGDSTNYAWFVNFSYGYVRYDNRSYSLPVRLVRASQSLDIGLNDPTNVVLFLHGMNSSSGTWKDFVVKYFANANCPGIYDGKIVAAAKPNAQNTYCYRINFGAFDDASPNKGLEDAWEYGESNGYNSAGDYSTFNQLGLEVNRAVAAIKDALPNAQILLVAHSRGGLAARTFLHNAAYAKNKAGVVGLITTGTPHQGTPLGRIYNYIATIMLNADGTRQLGTEQDWRVVDFLNGAKGDDFNLDARRPVIGYLADNSPEMKEIRQYTKQLPAIKYGQLVYTKLALGNLGEKYWGPVYATYGLFHDETTFEVKEQLSTAAEGAIKGWASPGVPRPSKDLPGDGIIPVGNQQGLPNKPKTMTGQNIRHTEEPKKTAQIVDLMCRLNFDWVKGCMPAAQARSTKQAKAPFKAVTVVSHDYDALVALPVDALWQDWLALITDDAQANQREQLAVALGIKLRDSDNAAFYADVEQRLLDSHLPQLERARLAKLLAEIATPSALEVLTDALLNPDALAIQTALSNAILSVADSLPEQPRRADLSAVLEVAWAIPKQNQQQLNTLALALAKLGTARGVELLLTAVDKTGAVAPSAKKKYLNTAEQQATAAFSAMDEIINPDSETVLSRAFMSHRATEAVFIAAGTGLANLGREDAAQHVLQRLNELPDNAVPVGQHWLNNLSGKIDKTALRRMNKAVRMPKQRLLRQQMEEMME